MTIYIKKFGTTLISRQTGKEAWAAFQPSLQNLPNNETIEVDFEGVMSLAPSWADEFLTPLRQRFGDRLSLFPSENLSVKATLELLEKIHG